MTNGDLARIMSDLAGLVAVIADQLGLTAEHEAALATLEKLDAAMNAAEGDEKGQA